MFKLVATSSLLLAVSTLLPSATATTCPNGEVETTINCGEGQIQCWVYDPARPALPWQNSTYTWPQCYTPVTDPNNINGTYVCTDDLFLCPSNAPVNCGGACYGKNESLTAPGCINGAGFKASANNGHVYPSTYINTTTNATATWTVFPDTIARGCVTSKVATEIAASGGGGSSGSGSGSSGTGGASGSGSGSTSGTGAGGSAGKSQSGSAATQTVSMMLGSLMVAALITIF